MLGDKAYSSRANRGHLRRRKIKATITQPKDQRERRRRNTVERCINLLKQDRAVATRYDKRAVIFDGTVLVASIQIWLRNLIRSQNSA
nr:transposase [Nocardiopsis deserti]